MQYNIYNAINSIDMRKIYTFQCKHSEDLGRGSKCSEVCDYERTSQQLHKIQCIALFNGPIH